MMMSKARHRIAKVVLGCVLGAACIVWLAIRSDLSEVGTVIVHASPIAVATTLAIVYFTIPLRALQWAVLLGVPAKPLFAHAVKSQCLGYLGDLVLPFRGGDAVRAVVMADASKTTIGRVLPSLVLCRMQDIPPIATLAAASYATVGSLLLADRRSVENGSIGSLGLGVIVGLAVFALAVAGIYVARARSGFDSTLDRLSEKIRRGAAPTLRDCSAGMRAAASWKRLGASQAISIACWVSFSLAAVPLLTTVLGLDLRAALVTGFVQNGISVLALVLPAAPGAVGTYHALCVFAVTTVNPSISEEQALAYAVLAHAVGTLGPALTGLPYLPDQFLAFRNAADVESSKTEVVREEL